ncbi:probable zinc finger CCCH domain-containing protein 2 at N-terminal half [Coccomyxa sp. Obi]|nr:probable zinc finger CCCH domain-containing protein 2 at N-terminal half [Coccomyxa sp. Obi]
MEGDARPSCTEEDPVHDSDEFRMYFYKVKRCGRSRPHDWTQCPFSHSGEKAKRRCPRRYNYTGAACPDYRKNASCRRGDKCPFAHGVFESWLHPSRYRTQCCTDGVACKRRVCFFAHQESELRKPEDDPALLAAQLQAEALASTETYQQILATASLDAVPEAAPASSTPHLNLAILQSLLQNTGAAQRLPANWSADGDSQERSRVYQLQALLAALQLRAPAPLPPQPVQGDGLSSLDKLELGRLLAANQALVQQQAEREMLQRTSFEAARRNSMSSDVGLSDFGRQDSYLSAQGGGLQNVEYNMGDGGFMARNHFSPGVRRMSMDNAGTNANGSQSLDPRVLAALAAAQRGNAPGGQPQGRSAAVRRSVDMGMLAHAAALAGPGRHKQLAEQTSIPEGCLGMDSDLQHHPSPFAGSFNQGSIQRDGGLFLRQGSSFMAGAGQQQGMEQLMGLTPAEQVAALGASLAQGGPEGLPGSFQRNSFGQMNGQSQDMRRFVEQLSGQASGRLSQQPSGQLSAQSSGQFGGQGLVTQGSAAHLGSFTGQFLSQGSGALSSLGQMSGQTSSGLGSFGQTSLQSQASAQFRELQNHAGQPMFSPGRHSMSSADSLTRLDVQQHQQHLAQMGDAMQGVWMGLLEGDAPQGGGPSEQSTQRASPQLTQHEDSARNGSGSSTPSRRTPTPGAQGTAAQHCMVSPRDRPPSVHSSLYASSPASNTTTYDPSPRNMSMGMTGQPAIPEEGLPAWQASAQQLQSCAAEAQQQARKMPTLLEQLQLFERQRQGSMPLLGMQPSMAMARNTSFESLSAELPRSISDLNLADHNLGSVRLPSGIPASSS